VRRRRRRRSRAGHFTTQGRRKSPWQRVHAEEIGVGPLAIESLATGGQPHSLGCPAHTDSQQAVLTGVFETTLRKTDKDSDVYGDWAGADAIKLRLELSDGRAVITEYAPSGPVNGFDYGYSIFKDVIKFEGTGGSPSSARWELDGNRLRFSHVAGPPGGQFVWGRTWTRTDLNVGPRSFFFGAGRCARQARPDGRSGQRRVSLARSQPKSAEIGRKFGPLTGPPPP
jgi:hypothetical protein